LVLSQTFKAVHKDKWENTDVSELIPIKIRQEIVYAYCVRLKYAYLDSLDSQ